jgi:hypothetical protein
MIWLIFTTLELICLLANTPKQQTRNNMKVTKVLWFHSPHCVRKCAIHKLCVLYKSTDTGYVYKSLWALERSSPGLFVSVVANTDMTNLGKCVAPSGNQYSPLSRSSSFDGYVLPGPIVVKSMSSKVPMKLPTCMFFWHGSKLQGRIIKIRHGSCAMYTCIYTCVWCFASLHALPRHSKTCYNYRPSNTRLHARGLPISFTRDVHYPAQGTDATGCLLNV